MEWNEGKLRGACWDHVDGKGGDAEGPTFCKILPPQETDFRHLAMTPRSID
jgi:hypothetical protein